MKESLVPTADLQNVLGFSEHTGNADVGYVAEESCDNQAGSLDSMWLDVGGEG